MRTRFCAHSLGLASGLVLVVAPVAANPAAPPSWDIAALCSEDSASGQCRILEQEAQRAISGGWDGVPAALREACLAAVKSPYDKSYRLLSSCIEHEVLRGLDRDIVATAATARTQASPRSAFNVAGAAETRTSTTSVTKTEPHPFAWPYVDPADPSVTEEAKRRAEIAAALAAAAKAREMAEAAAEKAASEVRASAIVWPYVDPADPSVTEEAQRRAAVAAALATATKAREMAEAAEQAAPAARTTAIAWPYVDPGHASVAEEANRRAAIAAALATATKAREMAEAAAEKAASAARATAIAWPYLDPADPSVTEEAKRRAEIAAELKAAAEARGKAEEEARLATAAHAIGTAQKQAATTCQSALDAAGRSGPILFKSSSADIDPESAGTLNLLADAARSCGNVRITIAGHTDATGSEERNMTLSEARARSVASYLARKGVDQAQLVSIGFGETKPIAPNDTPAGRAKNRRIDFTVVTD